MNVTLLGAAREVTGSCYFIQTKGARLLIDCGMFQGSAYNDAKNFQDFNFDPASVDAVAVTHAHLDHVGRLPKLVMQGYTGPIFLTPPTKRIAAIVLEDAERIMDDEFEREYRPKLYERKDVERTIARMKGVPYSRWITVGDIRFRFRDAGHIFGSAFIEVEEQGGGKAVFSGDLGNIDVPILRPTAQMQEADAVFVESTYGDRIHEDERTRTTLLTRAVKETIAKKGVLLIPSFAIERTQDLLYFLNGLVESKRLPPTPVYLDSPMAIDVASVMKEFPDYYDRDATKRLMKGDDFLKFRGLVTTKSVEESKAINGAPKPKIIIAGSGMMNGGRILHHLIRYLPEATTTVLIIGYQAQGTLGRRLYSGERRVTIFGERIPVKARIMSIGAMSAHADQRKLLNWIREGMGSPGHVYCTHGEEAASSALRTRVMEELGIPADVPRFGETVVV
jgi:metallo-beta-lactamase family protein